MTLLSQLEELKNNINLNQFNNFKIDVGTAIDAPHSAHWLFKEKDAFVLAIEPNSKNISILEEGSFRKPSFYHLRLKDNSILSGNKVISKYEKNNFFILKNIAIDDVKKIEKKDFFCTDDRNTGCSSLLEPTDKLGLDVEKVEIVEVASLEFILNYINFPNDKKIKFVKTDTQGKDFDVVKSLGKYLQNVVGIKSEYNTLGQYKFSNSEQEFLEYMTENNFRLIERLSNDFYFLNNNFLDEKNVFDLPEGI